MILPVSPSIFLLYCDPQPLCPRRNNERKSFRGLIKSQLFHLAPGSPPTAVPPPQTFRCGTCTTCCKGELHTYSFFPACSSVSETVYSAAELADSGLGMAVPYHLVERRGKSRKLSPFQGIPLGKPPLLFPFPRGAILPSAMYFKAYLLEYCS